MRVFALVLALAGCGSLVRLPDGARPLTTGEEALLVRVDTAWRAEGLDTRGRCGPVQVLEVPLDEAKRRCFVGAEVVGVGCYLRPHFRKPYIVVSADHPLPDRVRVHEFVHYREDCWLGRADPTHSRERVWTPGGVNERAQEGL